MANLTERNGLVLSCEPSLCPHSFLFCFFFFFLQFVMFLFCFILFLFLLIFQADTSLFLSHLIVENLILHIFLIIMIIIPCSGMFWNVPCSCFYRRPVKCAHEDLQGNNSTSARNETLAILPGGYLSNLWNNYSYHC